MIKATKAIVSIAEQLKSTPKAPDFDPKIFRSKLVRFISVSHQPFALVESDEFRDLLLYASPHLRGNDILHKSGTSIRSGIEGLYSSSQAQIIEQLKLSSCQVHLSFDLWTSPNTFSLLGVCCHFMDPKWRIRTVILGIKRLVGSHHGVNIAPLIDDIFQRYQLDKKLGYFVMDNAGDNDTALRAVEKHLLSRGIVWNADAHRLRCFGHIINLVAGAFQANNPPHQWKEPRLRRPPGASKAPKPSKQRPRDAIDKIHDIAVFIMATAQRIEEFEGLNKTTIDDPLHPIKDQITRWFSAYLMLRRAVELKNSIQQMVYAHQRSTADEKNLSHCYLDDDDWDYVRKVLEFYKPLYDLVLELQSKDSSG